MQREKSQVETLIGAAAEYGFNLGYGLGFDLGRDIERAHQNAFDRMKAERGEVGARTLKGLASSGIFRPREEPELPESLHAFSILIDGRKCGTLINLLSQLISAVKLSGEERQFVDSIMEQCAGQKEP